MEYAPTLVGFPIPEDSITSSVLSKLGFRFEYQGVHSSRTMMLSELSLLLEECDQDMGCDGYQEAIVELNCLGKKTVSNRRITAQRLRELYGLDPSLAVFRLLRYFWDIDCEGRCLLALLAALSRDNFLRTTSGMVTKMEPGDELSRTRMARVLRMGTGNRLNDSTLDKVVRNTASSWTQSGHLCGHSHKVRQRVKPTFVVVTYAIFLGYLSGIRGSALFTTIWTNVLDASTKELFQLAIEARQNGLLDLKYTGGIVDISIDPLLTEEERMLIRGEN